MYQIFVVCADRFYNCIEYSRTMCVVYKCVDLMIYVLVPRNAIKLHLLQRWGLTFIALLQLHTAIIFP